jgi:hypothetical protein
VKNSQTLRHTDHSAILRVQPRSRIKGREDDSRIRDADAPATKVRGMESCLHWLGGGRKLRQQTNVGRDLERARATPKADFMDDLRGSRGKAGSEQSAEFWIGDTLVRHPDA